MLSVRALIGSDGPGVLRINSDGQPGVAQLDDSELRRLCSLPNHHLVAEDIDSLLVGYILAFDREAAYDGEEFLRFRLMTPKPYVYVDQIAVAKESKGLGVGKALYGALEAIARREGAHALCCEVNTVPRNPESMAFHEALGFRRVGSMATSDGREVELLLREIA
jgi:predicted GNAT superfamily acetyltransferase